MRSLDDHTLTPNFVGAEFIMKPQLIVDVIFVDLTVHKEGQTASKIDEIALSEGFERSLSFVRELRKTYKNIPIIVAGNTPTNGTLKQNRRADAAGASCFLSKSVDTSKLLETIEKIAQKDGHKH